MKEYIGLDHKALLAWCMEAEEDIEYNNLIVDRLENRLAEKDKQIEELREGLKESFKHLEEITWWEACPDDMKEEISKLINDSDLLSKETK